MAYPLHIQKPAAIVAQGGTPGSPLQQYVDRLIRLIPAEVIAAYQAIRGIVVGVAPSSPGAKSFLPWLPDLKTIQWRAVGIAAVSFIVLIISLGHPIVVETPIATWIGSVLLILWVFFLPYLYEGS